MVTLMLPFTVDGPGISRPLGIESVRGLVYDSRSPCSRKSYDGDSPVGAGKPLQRQRCGRWGLRVSHRFRTRLSRLLRQRWRVDRHLARRRDEKAPGPRPWESHERWADYKKRKPRGKGEAVVAGDTGVGAGAH